MIGVFDSGFGGLTILKEFIKELPEYDYIYLGDNARAPYGNKSQAAIYNYTKEAVDFLFKKDCELIIIACNTASAKALRKIQQEWLPKNAKNKRVLGVVIPVAEAAISKGKPMCLPNNKIGVIGTKATIESGVYEKELKKLNQNLEIYSQACPLLVPLIEEGWMKKPETKMILKKYLRLLKQKNIKTLILGCTHYPFLIKDIKRIMGKNCQVLDSPKIVAEKLKDYLARHPESASWRRKKLDKNSKRFFYTTDDPEKFKEFSEEFLGLTLNVERVNF